MTLKSNPKSEIKYLDRMLIALLDQGDNAVELSNWFNSKGHRCDVFYAPDVFRHACARLVFDIVVLDGNFHSNANSLEILHWIRKVKNNDVPVAFVGSSNEKSNIVEALLAGADDTITKPVKADELLDRLIVLAKLNGHTEQNVLHCPPYRFDKSEQLAYLDGESIELTSKEFEFAQFLFVNRNVLLTRRHLLASVWGVTAELNTRTVDVHVSRIRKKLQLNGSTDWELISVYQRGYKLKRIQTQESSVYINQRHLSLMARSVI